MKWVRLLVGINIFWLALSVLSDGINTLVLPDRLFGLADESNRATLLGLLTFIGLLAGMVVQPIAGTISDHTRRRWGRMGMLGAGLLLTLLALVIFAFAQGLLALALGYLLVQTSASVAQAAQQGFLPDLVPVRWRGRAAGVKSFMDIGGAMLGFMLLGYLLGAGESQTAITVIAALLVAGFVLTVLLVQERSSLRPDAPIASVHGSTPSFQDVFGLDLKRHRRFAWLVAARFLFLLGTFAVGRFLMFFIADRLGLDNRSAAEDAGTLLAALALMAVVSAPIAGWMTDRWGRVPVMYAGSLINAAGIFGLIFAANQLQIALFGILMAFGSGTFASANWAMTADLAPREEAARFYALANYGAGGALAAAGLFGPLMDLAQRLTPGSNYIVLFTGASLASLASAWAVRHLAQANIVLEPALEAEAGEVSN